MIVKVPSWLAYKLTGYSKDIRVTDYFTVIKETEKAYQVANIRGTEPIGWVAKSLVLDKKDDDTEEYNKLVKHYDKIGKENEKWLADYKVRHEKDVQERIQKRDEWLKNHESRFNELRKLENKDTWLSVHIDYNVDKTFLSVGLGTIDDLIESIKSIDLDKYWINFNTIRAVLKDKNGLYEEI